MRTTIADLAAESPLTYEQLAAENTARTLAATLAAMTPQQRIGAAAVVAERTRASISDALAIFGRLMDEAGLTLSVTLAAEEAPRCELCDEPAVRVGEQWTCPSCAPVVSVTLADVHAARAATRAQVVSADPWDDGPEPEYDTPMSPEEAARIDAWLPQAPKPQPIPLPVEPPAAAHSDIGEPLRETCPACAAPFWRNQGTGRMYADDGHELFACPCGYGRPVFADDEDDEAAWHQADAALCADCRCYAAGTEQPECLATGTCQHLNRPASAAVARAWDELAEQSRRDRETTQAGLRAFASLPVDPALLARAIAVLRLATDDLPRELAAEASLVADALVRAGRPAGGEWGTRARAA